jgi:hypothetical protein
VYDTKKTPASLFTIGRRGDVNRTYEGQSQLHRFHLQRDTLRRSFSRSPRPASIYNDVFTQDWISAAWIIWTSAPTTLDKSVIKSKPVP